MAPPIPTTAELVILQNLWTAGPASVREIHRRLGQSIGYTGMLKLLQIMLAKGLVARDESGRAHVYSAAKTREDVQDQMLADLASRVFAGSQVRLALRALSSEAISPAELQSIRALLDRADGPER